MAVECARQPPCLRYGPATKLTLEGVPVEALAGVWACGLVLYFPAIPGVRRQLHLR
jgi:hypothetical protein